MEVNNHLVKELCPLTGLAGQEIKSVGWYILIPQSCSTAKDIGSPGLGKQNGVEAPNSDFTGSGPGSISHYLYGLGLVISLSDPQFSQLCNGGDINIYHKG